MIDTYVKEFEEKVSKIREKKEYFRIKPNVCVVGEVSVGKSSLLNLLLGANIFKSSIGETTKKISKIKKNDDRIIFSELEGNEFKEKQIFERFIFNKPGSEFLEYLEIVDIPGYDGSFNNDITNYLMNNDYHIVLFIIDISKGFKKNNYELLNMLKNAEPYILFLLNKIDLYEDEDKDDIRDLIEKMKQFVEANYPKNKILGYIPVSANKFKNNDKLVKILQDIIILTSYVCTFKFNLDEIRDSYIYSIESYIEIIEQLSQFFIIYYLVNLNKGLQEISNFDIIMNGESSIKSLINNLNSNLEKLLVEIIEEINNSFKEYIKNISKRINEMAISYIDLLNINFHHSLIQKNTLLDFTNFNLEQVSYSNQLLDEVIGKIIVSYGAGLLARLALGSLIPGIGALVFLGSLIYVLIDTNNKANEIRSKVYDEIASKLPRIVSQTWSDICNEIKINYINQILSIADNPQINKFLDQLIFEAYNLNSKLSNFIIDNIEEIM